MSVVKYLFISATGKVRVTKRVAVLCTSVRAAPVCETASCTCACLNKLHRVTKYVAVFHLVYHTQ